MQNKNRMNTTFQKRITVPSVLFILLVSLISGIFPSLAGELLEGIKDFIFVNLNWIYIWSVTIFVIFLIYLVFSKYGDIRLGSNDSRPEHSFFSWVAMLFAAGMGIGLMYFSVAEPMQHYSEEVFADQSFTERAKNAQLFTFFHWGVHAWAIYATVGLALSYFAYRYRLPLSLRSCFYPLLKNKINGNWGDDIDIFALCSACFGITTSLGFGVVQVNAGLNILNIVPSTDFIYKILIVGILVSCSILSATSGVNRGIKILSSINIIGVIGLLLFVLFAGPTVYLIGSFTEGIGYYISNFFSLTFSTHAYEPEKLPWFHGWTILYWAWWISWSPFVGLFIARISKGRTIREFVGAVLILPTLFNFIFMAIFGNSASWFDFNLADGALSALATDPDALTFRFLEYLPLTSFSSILVISIIIIFFVTSADSGILVMDSIATKNAATSPKWQMVFMGISLAALSLLLLNVGGLEALQTMTLITALPFSLIMLMFIVSLMKALVIDRSYYDQKISDYTVPWSGEYWKKRLHMIVSSKDSPTISRFIQTTVREAMYELKEEFHKNGIEAQVKELKNPERIEIEIHHGIVNNFIYGVKNQHRTLSEFLLEEDNLPEFETDKKYYPKSYFGDARPGYDVQYFTKNELISDILKHYERFLEIISEEEYELFISRNANKNLR